MYPFKKRSNAFILEFSKKILTNKRLRTWAQIDILELAIVNDPNRLKRRALKQPKAILNVTKQWVVNYFLPVRSRDFSL